MAFATDALKIITIITIMKRYSNTNIIIIFIIIIINITYVEK